MKAAAYKWQEIFYGAFNDGGGAAAIYRIDTITNTLLQTVTLSGAVNVDWEDIAFDGTYFYVGDFGNNANGARTNLKIYKFPLSAIPDFNIDADAVIPSGQIEIINFTYSDQPQPPVPTSANNTKYDCEAMVVDGGKIHLFTKNWIDLTSTHYVINTTLPGNMIWTRLKPFPQIFSLRLQIRLRERHWYCFGLSKLWYRESLYGNPNRLHDGYYFNGNKRKINLPDATVMGQAEGITFSNSTYGYISNEKFVRSIGPIVIQVNQKLRSLTSAGFISPVGSTVYTFTGNGNWNDPSNWINNAEPPSTLTAGSEIIIDPVVGGACVLNIPYTLSSDANIL